MTNGTYPWSFVTQIFHSGQPSHGGDRKFFRLKKEIRAEYLDLNTLIIPPPPTD
jgi:hypothetical protein